MNRKLRERILEALGLEASLSDPQVADGLRALAGLPRQATSDPSLWVRFLEGIERACATRDGPRADLAELAHWVVSWAILPPGFPGADRFGHVAWDRELGTSDAQSDEDLRMFVIDEIAPRLWDAGLFYVIDYV